MTDQPWYMARVRSHQLPRKYKPVGPVGRKHGLDVTRDDGEVPSCRACGYHVCSCERQVAPDPFRMARDRILREACERRDAAAMRECFDAGRVRFPESMYISGANSVARGEAQRPEFRVIAVDPGESDHTVVYRVPEYRKP